MSAFGTVRKPGAARCRAESQLRLALYRRYKDMPAEEVALAIAQEEQVMEDPTNIGVWRKCFARSRANELARRSALRQEKMEADGLCRVVRG